jgi:hypothetical protein
VRKGGRGPSISAELRGSFEVVITGRCQENEGQLHPYLELGEDGNDMILDRVSVSSYAVIMLHKNNPLVRESGGELNRILLAFFAAIHLPSSF